MSVNWFLTPRKEQRLRVLEKSSEENIWTQEEEQTRGL
jgi:hypothetical protein